MRRAIALLALLASLVAFAVFVGGGLFLLAVESSGERGTGALIACGGAIALGLTLALTFTRESAFRGTGRAAAAVIAAFLAALPVGALAFAAFRFAGLPTESSVLLLDWTVFAVGVFLGAGAASILRLGYWRAAQGFAANRVRREVSPRAHEPRADTPRQRPELRRFDFEDDDDEVRVTRVR